MITTTTLTIRPDLMAGQDNLLIRVSTGPDGFVYLWVNGVAYLCGSEALVHAIRAAESASRFDE